MLLVSWHISDTPPFHWWPAHCIAVRKNERWWIHAACGFVSRGLKLSTLVDRQSTRTASIVCTLCFLRNNDADIHIHIRAHTYSYKYTHATLPHEYPQLTEPTVSQDYQSHNKKTQTNIYVESRTQIGWADSITRNLTNYFLKKKLTSWAIYTKFTSCALFGMPRQ